MRVTDRVGGEGPFPPNRTIDLSLRNRCSLFDDPVGHDDCLPSLEEVEHAVIHSLVVGTKLIDAVPEVIRMRSPECVAAHFEQLDPGAVAVLGLRGQRLGAMRSFGSPSGFGQSITTRPSKNSACCVTPQSEPRRLSPIPAGRAQSSTSRFTFL